MKTISFENRTFTIGNAQEKYEHWVDLTSKLIQRSYIATHKLVQDWPVEKIILRYETCTKHHGKVPPAVLWWHLRKKEKMATEKVWPS